MDSSHQCNQSEGYDDGVDGGIDNDGKVSDDESTQHSAELCDNELVSNGESNFNGSYLINPLQLHEDGSHDDAEAEGSSGGEGQSGFSRMDPIPGSADYSTEECSN